MASIDCYIPRPPRTYDVFEILRVLGPHFEAIFREPVPLAIGIHHDLLDGAPDGIGTVEIELLLDWWCNRREYLESLVNSGAWRRDALGRAVERVSATDRAVAAARLVVMSNADVVAASRAQVASNVAVVAASDRLFSKLDEIAARLAAPGS